jgi:integrase
VVADYTDRGQTVPPGFVKAWMAVLGTARAIDVRRDNLDTIVRMWRKSGIRWEKRDPKRVRPITAATANRLVAFLRRGYSLGREKLNLAHPTLTFPHQEERRNPRPIPPDILADIFEAMDATDAKGRRLEPLPRAKFLRFLAVAGPRKGQVLRTRAEQYTPATGTLRWTDEDTKQGLPHVVTYTGEARDILDWFVEHREPSSPALFQEDGQPLTKDMLDGTWQRACERAGVPSGRRSGYVIHDLRHTFVSDAHDVSLSSGVIMAHTGHVQEPTMLRYLRVSAPAQQRAQEQMDAYRRQQAEQIAARAKKVTRLAGRR